MVTATVSARPLRVGSWRVRSALAMTALALIAADQPGGSGTATVDTTRRSTALPLGVLDQLGEYQQIFDHHAFPGPVVITEIAFASAPGFGSPTHTWYGLEVGLSTTMAEPSSPHLSLRMNRGPDHRTVYRVDSQTFRARGDGSFDLVFPVTPFVYDPSKGNLLVEFEVHTHAGQQPLHMTAGTARQIGSVYRLPNSPVMLRNPSQGLLTRFTYRKATREDIVAHRDAARVPSAGANGSTPSVAILPDGRAR